VRHPALPAAIFVEPIVVSNVAWFGTIFSQLFVCATSRNSFHPGMQITLRFAPGYLHSFLLGDVGCMTGGVTIREFVRMDTNVIGRGVVSKSNRLNRFSPQKRSLPDAVHAIHDATIRRENNGKTQVCGLNQASVLHDRPASRKIAETEPKGFVKLSDCAQWDLNTRKVFGQRDEPINVPRQKATLRLAKVILLSHL
jgi:hypothetical protein